MLDRHRWTPLGSPGDNQRMPSQTMPQLMSQVDRLERQVALLSEKLGIPFEYSGNAAMPAEVEELVARGDTKGAVAKYRELTGAGLQEALDAVKGL
jgi:ribosomal protein L7/L12